MNKISRRWLWRTLIAGVGGFLFCTGLLVATFFLSRQLAVLPLTGGEIRVEEDLSPEPSTLPNRATPLWKESPGKPLQKDQSDLERAPAQHNAPLFDSSDELVMELEDLKLFLEVWSIVSREFDGEIPTFEELIYAAINGSLDTLGDDFTRLIPPETANRMREDLRGSFEGIGAFVRMTDEGLLQIVRPMPGFPAAKAGIQPNDIVLEVDGESIAGHSIDEAVSRVRGPRGTEVILTIQREGVDEPIQVTLLRERIELPTAEAEMLPEGIGYVRLNNFNSQATAQLTQEVARIMEQDPVALIFDLRDNPGGFLDQAITVADLFLSEGVLMYERNSNGLDVTFDAEQGGLAEEIDLVVLINAGSASASEIVAGAIRDHQRAMLIGETTFGKGSVQQVFTLSDGSELRVTVSRWYTPNNGAIDATGIPPDIEVLPSPVELGGAEDNQLQRAIEYILTGK
jgi:carboxyl-terminal processing protease